MKLKLKTCYKKQDGQGNAIACLSLKIESANVNWRDDIRKAIEKALAGPKPAPVEKSSAIGFHHPGPEDD